VARRLTESTLTRDQSSWPAPPSSSSSNSWSRSNTPAWAHSANRRQQVVTLPQPNSPTGSSAHGVEVRAMKMIAAMQARFDTVRGAPPRAWEGGVGSRGWTRCHSWSGSNRSAKVVMAGEDTQPQTGLPTWLADRHHPGMSQPCEILTCGQARLRRWRAADADTVYRVVMESLEHLRPSMPWASGFSRDDAVWFTAQSEQDWASGVAYQYAITTDDVVVGSCGLMRRIGPGGLEIGYWLHPAYTGRGLATAAVAALVSQAFALPDIERVEIVHDQANTASGGIPRRLGFTEVERRTPAQGLVAPGEVGIEVVWRLTRS
jgi:ribosomal-protein-serine acetyltransferase